MVYPQVVGYDGIPLSGSDADFLAYAARWQAAGKPGAIVSSAPSSAPPPPPPPAGWEVYAKQTDTAGFIKKMAISDGKLIKITNDKKELLQPHWQISVPDTYKLVEAAFVLPAANDAFPNSLLVKLTKPGSFEQPSVLVNLTYSRLPSDHKLVMRLWCVSSGA